MRLTDIAREARAIDLFALKSLDGDRRLFNIGGVGRGDGWAGNLTLDPASEPMLAKAVTSGFAYTKGAHPRRIFGPYWTSSAAVVGDGSCLVRPSDGTRRVRPRSSRRRGLHARR